MKNKRQKNYNQEDSNKKKVRKQDKNNKTFSFSRRDADALEPFMLDTGVLSSYFFDSPQDKANFSSNSGYSEYTYKKNPRIKYRYGFTDSTFLYCLGKMEPNLYYGLVSLLGMSFFKYLNQTEKKIVYTFLNNIADAMATLIEQEAMLESYINKNETTDLRAALDKDIAKLRQEIEALQQKMNQ